MRERANRTLAAWSMELHLKEDEVKKLSKKITSRGSPGSKDPNRIRPQENQESTPIDLRKRRSRKGPLKVKDKIEIVFQVMCLHAPAKHLAKKYRVTESYISLLVHKVKKKPELLRQLFEKDIEKEVKIDYIKDKMSNWS